MIGPSTHRLTAVEARQILVELRGSVTVQQVGILSTIWQHYAGLYPVYTQTGGAPPWMTLRELMRRTKIDKDDLLAILQPLGGSVITLKGFGSQQTWELLRPGLFLVPNADEYKSYLVECLRLTKRRSLDESPPSGVTGAELATCLGLPPASLNGCIAALSLSGFLNVGHLPDGDWSVQIPYDIDDFSQNADFESYVLQNTFAYFERGLPVQEYLQQDYRNRRTRLDQSAEGFWFISDAHIKRWLASDWLEVQTGLASNAQRSSAILCRSILEGLLLDALSDDIARSRTAYSQIRGRDLKKVPPLNKWMLQDLIDVAGQVGVLSPFDVKLSSIIQEYGNRVHLGRQLRESVEITADGAAVAVNAVRECIHALDGRARKKIAVQASTTT